MKHVVRLMRGGQAVLRPVSARATATLEVRQLNAATAPSCLKDIDCIIFDCDGEGSEHACCKHGPCELATWLANMFHLSRGVVERNTDNSTCSRGGHLKTPEATSHLSSATQRCNQSMATAGC
jgi:hypothetical protein